MTSKGALALLEARCRYFAQDNMELEETYEARETIEKDLEVLEILKKHLVVETEDDERKELGGSVNCYLKSWLSSDKEDYQKVKEWLETKEK